jgi:hypothetical protein
VNLKTAKALGVTIAPSILARAGSDHRMTPPIWLDAAGRPPQTLQIPDWCGCSKVIARRPARRANTAGAGP